MTAKRRAEKPEIHASKSTANVIKLLQPAVLRLNVVDLEWIFIVDSISFLFSSVLFRIYFDKSPRSQYTVNAPSFVFRFALSI